MDENELVADLREQLEAGEGRQEDLQAEVQHLQRQLRDLQAQRATAGVLAKGQTQEGHSEWQRLEDGSEQAQRELQVCYGVCKQRPAEVAAVSLEVFCSRFLGLSSLQRGAFCCQRNACIVFDNRRGSANRQASSRYKVQALMGSSGITIVHAGSSDSAQAGSG